MVNTIDMKDMRYLNLFEKITHIRTRFCFSYNDTLIFCVPRPLISKAIGEGGKNIRKIHGIIRKRIRVIPSPEGIEDAKIFITNVVEPVQFKEMEIKEGAITINAGSQSKAALIGRNKRRFLEMQKIIRSYFGKDFRIV